jgi:hypothetical protein
MDMRNGQLDGHDFYDGNCRKCGKTFEKHMDKDPSNKDYQRPCPGPTEAPHRTFVEE